MSGGKPSESAMGTLGIVALLLYFAPWILLPAYANSLYWRKVNKLIDELPRTVASQPDKRSRRLAGNGGTSIVVPLVVSLFGGLFGMGMMAAISIPAYQDYTIRAQVQEGLQLATPAKTAVAEFYARTGHWPANNAEAGFGGATGQYTTAVDIDKGSIIVSYGNKANEIILKDGGRIALTPGIDAAGDVVWVCGGASPPAGVTLSNGPSGIEIADKHVPSNCRGAPGGSREAN
jgi:type IV pilus assembly protein PilA